MKVIKQKGTSEDASVPLGVEESNHGAGRNVCKERKRTEWERGQGGERITGSDIWGWGKQD